MDRNSDLFLDGQIRYIMN